MARIAIDMDNVMADLTPQLIDMYEAEYGERIDAATLNGLPEGEGYPVPGVVHRYIRSAGFFRSLPVMKDSQEIIKSLSAQHEVFMYRRPQNFPCRWQKSWPGWENIFLISAGIILFSAARKPLWMRIT